MSDDLINQILDMSRDPMRRNHLEAFIRDSLDKVNIDNHQTLHANLRQCIEEKEAFRKSAEFWRSEYLAQADALDSRRVYLPVDKFGGRVDD